MAMVMDTAMADMVMVDMVMVVTVIMENTAVMVSMDIMGNMVIEQKIKRSKE